MPSVKNPKPRLRSPSADDAAAVDSFLGGLSSASRRQRFHGHRDRRSLAEQMCRVDGTRQQAWLAWVGDGSNAIVVGEARFVLDDESPGAAELGIAVAEDWRGRGLADALMRQMLIAASEANVQELYGEVLEDNERMVAFMHRHRFESDLFASGDVLRMRRVPSGGRYGPNATRMGILSRLFGSAMNAISRGRSAAATLSGR